MRLAEIAALIIVPGPAKSGFLGGKAPRVHLKHSRAAWREEAYLLYMEGLGMYIFGNGCSALFALGFDDLMADDWELAPDQADAKSP